MQVFCLKYCKLRSDYVRRENKQFGILSSYISRLTSDL